MSALTVRATESCISCFLIHSTTRTSITQLLFPWCTTIEVLAIPFHIQAIIMLQHTNRVPDRLSHSHCPSTMPLSTPLKGFRNLLWRNPIFGNVQTAQALLSEQTPCHCISASLYSLYMIPPHSTHLQSTKAPPPSPSTSHSTPRSTSYLINQPPKIDHRSSTHHEPIPPKQPHHLHRPPLHAPPPLLLHTLHLSILHNGQPIPLPGPATQR